MICPKNYQNARIFIFARKINKIVEFCMIFAKNAQILHDNYLKNIFVRNLGAYVPPLNPRLLRL